MNSKLLWTCAAIVLSSLTLACRDKGSSPDGRKIADAYSRLMYSWTLPSGAPFNGYLLCEFDNGRFWLDYQDNDIAVFQIGKKSFEVIHPIKDEFWQMDRNSFACADGEPIYFASWNEDKSSRLLALNGKNIHEIKLPFNPRDVEPMSAGDLAIVGDGKLYFWNKKVLASFEGKYLNPAYDATSNRIVAVKEVGADFHNDLVEIDIDQHQERVLFTHDKDLFVGVSPHQSVVYWHIAGADMECNQVGDNVLYARCRNGKKIELARGMITNAHANGTRLIVVWHVSSSDSYQVEYRLFNDNICRGQNRSLKTER